MVKVIICGSRTFNNYQLLDKKCREIFNNISNAVMYGDYKRDITIMEIISGGAKGADELGERFAFNNSIEIKRFIAKWDKYGKQAGMIRNTEMINYAAKKDDTKDYGMLIAFWDGKSKGTKQAIEYAERMKLDVRIIKYNT
jgi:hypothetical protein